MEIKRHSGVIELSCEQWLPLPIDSAWDFFSSPKNLDRITPDSMGFDITSAPPEKVYPGLIITYKVGIFPLIKSNWVTEITHLKEGNLFVDEQRFGPYKMWHHVHTFEEKDGGTLMKDIVTYKVPFGFIGKMANRLFVENQVRNIFNHRKEILNELFPKH